MRRAIALSNRGYPAPNPHVGCVMVKDGEIVGEGYHAFAGGPHAEVVALAQAGTKAKGSTCYVTLEPCNHSGRTGPCTEALIEAGVRRVVAAVRDPNPEAKGGLERLSEAGIEVEGGLLLEESAAANRIWLRAMDMGRPFVAVKAAVSLDGRTALPSGESKWITGPEARAQGRKLRAEMGAVLVGVGTVLADDPQLTSRTRGVRNEPLRLVLDPNRRAPDASRVFSGEEPALRIVASGLEQGPAEIGVPMDQGKVDLRLLLDALWRRGVTGLLVEGGARTIGGFLEAGLVDRVDLFVAPKVLGAGPVWAEGIHPQSLSEALGFTEVRTRRLGQDVWIQSWR